MIFFWSLYFAIITYWQLTEVISAHAFYNLFLVTFAFFPVSKRIVKRKTIIILRNIFAVIMAIILLWHESYLPPIGTISNFLINPELRPSANFLFNFVLSLINIKLVAFLIVIISFALAVSLTKLKKYFGLFFIFCFLILGFTERNLSNSDLVSNFYSNEASKKVSFSINNSADIDVVILQLCSFSWSDFEHLNYNISPFLKQFNYIFTNFNSATSYSNPAVIRLLRGACGQSTHEQLFISTSNNCYLIPALKNLGYHTYTVLNHDGNYSGFTDAITKYGKADMPLDNSHLTADQKSFDNTPIYNDFDALSLWASERIKRPNSKSALFYNSITLHTGSIYQNKGYLSYDEEYRLALNKVIGDFNKFFEEIKKSNRNTMVIVVGEHGAALNGSVLQPATIREIPLPSITLVPAAVKFFGPGFNQSLNNTQTIIDTPTSYLGLTELMSRIIATPPQNIADLKTYKVLKNLPQTSLVSENETSAIFNDSNNLFYRLKKYKTWNILPSSLMSSQLYRLIF